jgi:hypothetical protein
LVCVLSVPSLIKGGESCQSTLAHDQFYVFAILELDACSVDSVQLIEQKQLMAWSRSQDDFAVTPVLPPLNVSAKYVSWGSRTKVITATGARFLFFALHADFSQTKRDQPPMGARRRNHKILRCAEI